MSMFEKLRDNVRRNAEKVADQHGDTIARGLDRAARSADERTGRKHSAKIRTGVQKAKQGLERLESKGDPGTPPPGTRPESGPDQPPGTGSTPPR